MATSVLITGGAGFIGTALSKRLIGAGHDVAVLDNFHPQVHAAGSAGADLSPAVELFIGDVTHAPDLDAALSRFEPSQIVHLAAETGTGQSLASATRHGSVNVVGTTQLIDALSRAGHVPDQIVLASSRAVYGEGAWQSGTHTYHPGTRSHAQLTAGHWTPQGPANGPAVPIPSSAAQTPPRPTNVYAATKLAQEHILAAWAAAHDTHLSVLRLQNVYGPGQSLTNPYTGIVTLFARLASEGRQLEVYEDGGIIRDLVFIDDVVEAFLAALGRPGSRCVDIGSGSAVTILELAEMITASRGAPAPVVVPKFRDGDVRAASCEIATAYRELDWQPNWSLDDGLAALLDSIGAPLRP